MMLPMLLGSGRFVADVVRKVRNPNGAGHRWVWLGLAVPWLLNACSSMEVPCGLCDHGPGQQYFALAVNREDPLISDHRGGSKKASPQEFKEELRKMRSAILESRKKRIVLFVHGGLVSLRRSSEDAVHLARAMNSDPSGIFPVFINWNTSMWSSYPKHLISDDAGVYYTTSGSRLPVRLLMAGLNLTGDIGMGLSRLPTNALRSSARLSERNRGLAESFPKSYPEHYSFSRKLDKDLGVLYQHYRGHSGSKEEQYPHGFVKPYRNGFGFHVGLGPDKVAPINERSVTTALWSPVKGGTLTFAEGVGRGAWDNMNLRANLLVHRHAQFFKDSRRAGLDDETSSGDGPGLMLVRELNAIAKTHDLQLELYGHSMGAIVLNAIIDEIARPGHEYDLEASKLVYMAAACRINDFRRTAGRYVEKTKTRFYNLCLHPTQEARESLWNNRGSPVISGSLLTYIDSMFERPPSFGDRTLGSFQNAVLAESLLPKGRHVTLKGFGADFIPVREGGFFRRDSNSDLGPQKHGSFNDYAFWKERFLHPGQWEGFKELIIDKP